MSLFVPESVDSQGKDGWWFLPAAAVPSAVTVAETTAVGTLHINMSAQPGIGTELDQSKVEDKRHGAAKTYERFGQSKDTLADFIFIDRPQDAPAAATAKHRDVMAAGVSGYLLNRRGLGSAPENFATLAVGNRYRLIPVTFGAQVEQPPPDDGGPLTYKQGAVVTGPIVRGVIVA